MSTILVGLGLSPGVGGLGWYRRWDLGVGVEVWGCGLAPGCGVVGIE